MGRELYLLWQVQNTKDELLKLRWPGDTVYYTTCTFLFKPLSGEEKGEHREQVGSRPEAAEYSNKAAPRRTHQARAGSAKDRLLEPQESPAWPWNAYTATGECTRWAHACARARDRKRSRMGRVSAGYDA